MAFGPATIFDRIELEKLREVSINIGVKTRANVCESNLWDCTVLCGQPVLEFLSTWNRDCSLQKHGLAFASGELSCSEVVIPTHYFGNIISSN